MGKDWIGVEMALAIVIVGMPASGKNFARHYAEQNGMNYLATGDIVRLECASRGLDITAENMASISDELRGHDPAELTRWLLDRIERDMKKEPVIIMEGMRSWEEIELIRSRHRTFVVAFVAGKELRKERFSARGRADDDPAYFENRDCREVEYGTAVPIAMADHFVVNSGTVEETAEMLTRVMDEIFSRS